MNMKNLTIAIIIAGLIIAGAVVYTKYQNCPTQQGPTQQALSSQEAGERAINYINENLLQGKATASLIDTIQENGLYKVKFKVGDQDVETYITLDGKIFFLEGTDLTQVTPPAQETGKAAGNFSISSDEVCQENGKPVIYFFGSTNCPHCAWEHPIVEEVIGKFGDEIVFHNNMDSQQDMDIFRKYSTGGIPTLVLGCKYYRVGSGEAVGKEQEIKDLTSLICQLTNKQPAEICQ